MTAGSAGGTTGPEQAMLPNIPTLVAGACGGQEEERSFTHCYTLTTYLQLVILEYLQGTPLVGDFIQLWF